MNKIAPYAKAVIGALVAALGALGAALTPDANGLVSVSEGEWVAVISALLVGLLAVFATPNRDPEAEHQEESVQPAPRTLPDVIADVDAEIAAERAERARVAMESQPGYHGRFPDDGDPHRY